MQKKFFYAMIVLVILLVICFLVYMKYFYVYSGSIRCWDEECSLSGCKEKCSGLCDYEEYRDVIKSNWIAPDEFGRGWCTCYCRGKTG